MKVKLQEYVYIPTPTRYSTCKSCVFLSNDQALCDAPDSIYSFCVDCNLIFAHSRKLSKIFDL